MSGNLQTGSDIREKCVLKLGYRISSISSRGYYQFQCMQGAGTIRGREQYKGGVNIARQRMQSRVLARMQSRVLRHKVLFAASNERCCLSRHLCCGVRCHPSRLYSALDRSPCRGVSYLLHLEPHPPCVNFIIVRALFEGGVNFA